MQSALKLHSSWPSDLITLLFFALFQEICTCSPTVVYYTRGNPCDEFKILRIRNDCLCSKNQFNLGSFLSVSLKIRPKDTFKNVSVLLIRTDKKKFLHHKFIFHLLLAHPPMHNHNASMFL